jgi:hypothetical protein
LIEAKSNSDNIRFIYSNSTATYSIIIINEPNLKKSTVKILQMKNSSNPSDFNLQNINLEKDVVNAPLYKKIKELT